MSSSWLERWTWRRRREWRRREWRRGSRRRELMAAHREQSGMMSVCASPGVNKNEAATPAQTAITSSTSKNHGNERETPVTSEVLYGMVAAQKRRKSD